MSEVDDLRDGWKIIQQQMKEKRVTPDKLARQTQYPADRINRGIGGEREPIPRNFLIACVRVFGLLDARKDPYGQLLYVMSDDDLWRFLKPKPGMPPRQGNFWEWDEWSDS
jgi:hypothetical protein